MNESLLYYNQEAGLWEGEDGERRVSMSHETFVRYVLAWVELKMKTQVPTMAQMELGVQHCRRLKYWKDCERNYDPAVKVQRRGQGEAMKTLAYDYD